MQQQMTVGKKLALTSGALVAGMVLMGAISIYRLAELNRITQLIITDPLPGMDTMAAARAATMTARGDLWMHIAHTDPAVKAKWEQSFEENKAKAMKALQDYEPTITTPEDRALFDKLKPAAQRWFDVASPVLAFSREGKSDEAVKKADAELIPAMAEVKDLLQAEIDLNRTNGEKDAAESQQTYGKTIWILTWTLALCALAGTLGAFFVIRGLNKVLRRSVTELAVGAEQVASAAGQVASSSQSLAQGASEQAASLGDQLHVAQECRKLPFGGRPGNAVTRKVRRNQPVAGAHGGRHGRDQELQRQNLQDHQDYR